MLVVPEGEARREAPGEAEGVSPDPIRLASCLARFRITSDFMDIGREDPCSLKLPKGKNKNKKKVPLDESSRRFKEARIKKTKGEQTVNGKKCKRRETANGKKYKRVIKKIRRKERKKEKKKGGE